MKKELFLLMAGLSVINLSALAEEVTVPVAPVAATAQAAAPAPALDPQMQTLLVKARTELAPHHAQMEEKLNKKYADLPPEERSKKVAERLAVYDERWMKGFISRATGQNVSIFGKVFGSVGVAVLGIAAPRVMMDVAAAEAKSGVVGKMSGAVVNGVPNNGFGNMGGGAIADLANNKAAQAIVNKAVTNNAQAGNQ